MKSIHISDVEAVRDFAGLLAKVRAGAHVVIEHDEKPVATLQPSFQGRTIEECLLLLPKDSSAVIDEDFGRDMDEVKAYYWNQPRESPWD